MLINFRKATVFKIRKLTSLCGTFAARNVPASPGGALHINLYGACRFSGCHFSA